MKAHMSVCTCFRLDEFDIKDRIPMAFLNWRHFNWLWSLPCVPKTWTTKIDRFWN